jgi:hypothetical protein
LALLRSRRLMGLTATIVLAVVGIVSVATPASAAGNGQYSVFPATIEGGGPSRVWFNYNVKPGSTITDAATVTNYTDAPLDLVLYAADATNAAGGGAFSINPPNAPKKSVGSWTTLSSTEFTMPPHTIGNIPFTFTVPADTPPGDYAGGIVLVPKNPSVEKRGDVNIGVYQAVGARIYTRVAGPLHPRLDVTKLSVNPDVGVGGLFGGPVDATVTYRLTNTGNQLLDPTAKLEVSPLIGGSKTLKTRRFPVLLPKQSVTVVEKVDGILPFGKLTAHLTVHSQAGTTSASDGAWVIPWLLLALVLALAVTWWVVARRRRQRRGGMPPGAAGGNGTPAAGGSLAWSAAAADAGD